MLFNQIAGVEGNYAVFYFVAQFTIQRAQEGEDVIPDPFWLPERGLDIVFKRYQIVYASIVLAAADHAPEFMEENRSLLNSQTLNLRKS